MWKPAPAASELLEGLTMGTDCHCHGECGSCRFGDCERLGQELRELDAVLAEMEGQAKNLDHLAVLTKSLASLTGDRSGVRETAEAAEDAGRSLDAMRAQRDLLFDRWAGAGCSLLGVR
jgi:hypothetical protein